MFACHCGQMHSAVPQYCTAYSLWLTHTKVLYLARVDLVHKVHKLKAVAVAVAATPTRDRIVYLSFACQPF